MTFLHKLKLRFCPPRLVDPDFGNLIYMYIPNHPERSYWECEWLFPNTKTRVAIGLDGDESGPKQESREFHLGLPAKFDRIVSLCRPKLAEVFKTWIEMPLPDDVFSMLKLSGFAVDNPSANPIHWDISFETIGEKWLGITIPFLDEVPQDIRVDT